ncbi:MAG TPA: metallophosphoesterase family protein [Chitinophagaceae bacterium]|jgi:putative phosphoesterase|nr:metallophosphoesterase family protein [Chitinophagaceae bacterium]
MKRIGLISDTHGYLDKAVLTHFDSCDEIWHAGDFGSIEIADELKSIKPLKGVYGNIDGYDVRSIYPQHLGWQCEGVTVYMTHIGGYPKRYAPGIKSEIMANKAGLFICGHSHILKIIYDDEMNCLHINPGAAGKQGWHKMRTLVRLTIDGTNMKDCEVIELGPR